MITFYFIEKHSTDGKSIFSDYKVSCEIIEDKNFFFSVNLYLPKKEVQIATKA